MSKRLLIAFILFAALAAAAAGCAPQVDLSKKSARSAATLTPFLPKATFTDTPPAPVVDQVKSSPSIPDQGEDRQEADPSETVPAAAQPSATSQPSDTPAAAQTTEPALTATDPPPTATSASPTKTDKPPTAQPTKTPEKDTKKTENPSATPQDTTAPSKTPQPTPTPVPATDTPQPAGCSFSGNAGYESKVVELINNERKKRDLPALSMNSNLRQAARKHSEDMACNDHFSHTGTDGSSPWDRIRAAGYSYSYAAENIAASSSQSFSPSSVVSSWMNSSGHKKNILSDKAKHIGVGFRYAENDDSPLDAYYTADFASP